MTKALIIRTRYLTNSVVKTRISCARSDLAVDPRVSSWAKTLIG